MMYDAIVIGVSAGGLYALIRILEELPPSFPVPVIIVQHRSKDERTLLEEVLQSRCQIHIKQADEKEPIGRNMVYIAPADYHLLVEKDRTFSLTCDARVNYSRPSIDILFETSAEVYGNNLLGILLTGANNDGTAGMKQISRYGGTTIVQDPRTAEYAEMPQSAIDAGCAQQIMDLDEIKDFLLRIV